MDFIQPIVLLLCYLWRYGFGTAGNRNEVDWRKSLLGFMFYRRHLLEEISG